MRVNGEWIDITICGVCGGRSHVMTLPDETHPPMCSNCNEAEREEKRKAEREANLKRERVERLRKARK